MIKIKSGLFCIDVMSRHIQNQIDDKEEDQMNTQTMVKTTFGEKLDNFQYKKS